MSLDFPMDDSDLDHKGLDPIVDEDPERECHYSWAAMEREHARVNAFIERDALHKARGDVYVGDRWFAAGDPEIGEYAKGFDFPDDDDGY